MHPIVELDLGLADKYEYEYWSIFVFIFKDFGLNLIIFMFIDWLCLNMNIFTGKRGAKSIIYQLYLDRIHLHIPKQGKASCKYLRLGGRIKLVGGIISRWRSRLLTCCATPFIRMYITSMILHVDTVDDRSDLQFTDRIQADSCTKYESTN